MENKKIQNRNELGGVLENFRMQCMNFDMIIFYFDNILNHIKFVRNENYSELEQDFKKIAEIKKSYEDKREEYIVGFYDKFYDDNLNKGDSNDRDS